MSEYEAVGIADVKELKNTKGRILAVDYGEVRTGLAICDASRFLASGIGNVKVGGIDKTAAEVARIAKEKGAVAAVVGLPRNMDGSEGARADRCRDFARPRHPAPGGGCCDEPGRCHSCDVWWYELSVQSIQSCHIPAPTGQRV